jgi:hypothetical protein
VKVTESGVPIEALITAIKQAVKRARVARSSGPRDLQVESVQLVLQALATKGAGGALDFRIPFIGMKVRTGAKVTRSDTQTISMTLEPPAQPGRVVRSGGVEDALVDAIVTIRSAMALAAAGDDPWNLSAGVIDITFAVTKTGTISVGVDGDLSDEVTQSLRLTLTPFAPRAG